MPYLASGEKVDLPLSSKFLIIPKYFWMVVNFFVFFFKTITEPFYGGKPGNSQDYRVSGQGPDPFGPGGGGRGRRMGGFRRGPGAPGPPPMSGGG